VHRAVKLVAEGAASVTYLAYEGDAAREPHPLTSLLARPNPRQERAAFLEALCAHLLLAGNGYVEAVTLDGAVRELYALRPDRMRVVPGPDGWPEAYEYAVACRRSCIWRNSIRSTITTDCLRSSPPRSRSNCRWSNARHLH
jgi:phage portal protein BeeE